MGRIAVLGLVVASLVATLIVACSDDDTTSAPVEADSGTPTSEAGGDDAAVDPDTFLFERGEKIAATQDAWTFVPFADSSCANGSPTGIGVNLGTSKRLVIFVEGGGACWSTSTCYVLKTATNIDTGFDEAAFKTRAGQFGKSLFDRTATDNPFKSDNFVYVPYCTGDVHAGAREADYDGQKTKHFGRKNFEAFLKRIVPTFEDSERVILSGASAGGFGATVNYWKTQYAFGKVRVDLLDDSGPPFPPAKTKYLADWTAAWDLIGALPPGCTACSTDFANAFPYYAKKYTSSRFALLSYTRDGVISTFYSLVPTDFEVELNNQLATSFTQPNTAAFIVAGEKHTMLGDLSIVTGGTSTVVPLDAGADAGDDAGDAGTTTVITGGTKLTGWLSEMVGGAPSWKTVGP